MAMITTATMSITSSNSCKDKNSATTPFSKSLGMSKATTTHEMDRIKLLYPMVNEEETPLPRQWGTSTKDKFTFLGLSQNNLRVHYKGSGKNHKDAASVRATHPIPASCGIYYFEVKVISKGRDGYMGIGLSAMSVNLNRLPGWDKNSYGYHGDDGNSFCSSGTGQPYGPTFTTGDVIGCCVNLIENSCFYTRNGINLGVAFRDLPQNLYPTVGLQTPGEVVEANFGQTPFIFDIEDYMKEWQQKIRSKIETFPVPNAKGEWQIALQKIVTSYLIHHGYCATAEAFARSTGQSFDEEIASIKNRQKIQKLVLCGHIGEAIEATQELYPGLLDHNSNLLFMLKCRQFIEMVNGTDKEISPPIFRNSHVGGVPENITRSPCTSPMRDASSSHVILKSNQSLNGTSEKLQNLRQVNSTNLAMNGEDEHDSDTEMDTMELEDKSITNGTSNGACVNGESHHCGEGDDDDEFSDPGSERQQAYIGNAASIERILQFGRDLHTMGEQLKKENGTNEANKKALKDAFSLLAYSNPWNSPVGHQLNPVQREPVCKALNSAILELQGLPKQPPLELAIAHATQCLKLMSKAGIGACAFASITDILC